MVAPTNQLDRLQNALGGVSSALKQAMSAVETLRKIDAVHDFRTQVPTAKIPEGWRGRPMLTLNGAFPLLQLGVDRIKHAIEEGKIEWAFDMSVNGKRGHVLLRIPLISIEAFAKGDRTPIPFDSLFESHFPDWRRKQWIAGDLSWLFNIHETQTAALIKAGEFKIVGSRQRGNCFIRFIDPESIRAFLKRRRYPKT